MPPTLTFLHTSPVHIETFDALLKERAPDSPAAHVVGADFLAAARTQGISPDLTRRIRNQTAPQSPTAPTTKDMCGKSRILCARSRTGEQSSCWPRPDWLVQQHGALIYRSRT